MALQKTFFGFIVLALSMLLLTAACGASDDIAAPDPSDSGAAAAAAPAGSAPGVVLAEIGKPAPDFTITAYENENHAKGEVVSLSDLKGKPVVISFWFPSCYDCGELLWLLKNSYAKHKDDVQYVVLQVSADVKSLWDPGSNEVVGQEYVRDKELPFLVGADPDRSIATAYDVQAYPNAYFLDKDQNLVAVENFLRAKQIEESIERAAQ